MIIVIVTMFIFKNLEHNINEKLLEIVNDVQIFEFIKELTPLL